MNDLLMLLIILLLLLILISSLGGSITVAPRYEGEMFSANKKRKTSTMRENFSEKKSKSNKSRSKKLEPEHFTTNNHVNSQDCVQTKVVGLCDGPCDGGHGQRKVEFKTLKHAKGDGKACLAPTTETCINHTPCPVKAKEHFQEEMGFEAMDNSYGLAPF